jgi:hypothetical protein
MQFHNQLFHKRLRANIAPGWAVVSAAAWSTRRARIAAPKSGFIFEEIHTVRAGASYVSS